MINVVGYMWQYLEVTLKYPLPIRVLHICLTTCDLFPDESVF